MWKKRHGTPNSESIYIYIERESVYQRNKLIVVFLSLTFILIYGSHALIAWLLNQDFFVFEDLPIQLLSILGGGSPAFVTLFILFRYYDADQKRRFWQSVYAFKTKGWVWMAMLGLPLILGLGLHWAQSIELNLPELSPALLIQLPVMFAFSIFAGGAEELGWRGILQEQLKGRMSLSMMGIFIGIIWALWHGPMFLIDAFAHYDYNFFIYLLTAIVFSQWLTLLVHGTGSVGLAVLMHAGFNTIGNLGFNIPMEFSWVSLVLLLLIVLINGMVSSRL